MQGAGSERSVVVARLFFVLSGEHENLPLSELKAIVEAEGYSYSVLEKLDQVARLEVDGGCVEALRRRAALTRLCGVELFTCEAEMKSIAREMCSINLDDFLGDGETFVVRIKRVRDHASKVDLMTLERKLGELILDSVPDARVNLKKPNKTFVGVLTNGKLVFGLKLAEIVAKPFVERRPRKKPFFHPSAMQAKLARCMVNLAKPKAGELVVDPFCGTGSMLTEASLIGCRIVGFDIQRRMTRGTLRNLRHFGAELEGIVVADARNIPLFKADCVVTDPPYGISSTTRKRTTEQLVVELLKAVYDILDSGRRVCLAAPRTLKISKVGVGLGYKHLESHFVYVHRSLTREIVVFEKA
jgi:tRNA (guanine10-N2)-dimethyltransferase